MPMVCDIIWDFEFEVPGEPKGKARPKVTRNGTFTPKATREYEELVRDSFRRYCPDSRPIEKSRPVRVYIEAYFTKAKSAKGPLPVKRPDWDNIGKIICDALNGVAYYDDAQIVTGTVIKRYAKDNMPFVRVRIEDISEEWE